MARRSKGWNEGLDTYVLAAASPWHGIEPAVYFNGFVNMRMTVTYINRMLYHIQFSVYAL